MKHFLLKLHSWKHADSLIFTGDFPKKDYLKKKRIKKTHVVSALSSRTLNSQGEERQRTRATQLQPVTVKSDWCSTLLCRLTLMETQRRSGVSLIAQVKAVNVSWSLQPLWKDHFNFLEGRSLNCKWSLGILGQISSQSGENKDAGEAESSQTITNMRTLSSEVQTSITQNIFGD